MAITDRARRTHDALFPGHVSTLQATDCELVEMFDNWPAHAQRTEGRQRGYDALSSLW